MNAAPCILEVIGAKIKFGKHVIKIISIYRPPKTDSMRTIQDFEKLLDSIGNDGNIILAGDANISFDKQSKLRLDYEKQLLDHRLNQYVNYYTRITAETVSLIDHTISNINDLETMVTHEMCADHQTVVSIWGMKEKETNNAKVARETKQNIHIDKSIENLQKVNWLDWNQETENWDINDTYNSFHEIVTNAVVHENIKSRKLKPTKTWMTKELLKKRLEVAKVRKRFFKNRNKNNENIYKEKNKEYRLDLKKAKHDYFAEKLKNARKNPKLTWEIIKEALNRKSKSEKYTNIIYNDKEIIDDIEIANIFSQFYKNTAVDKIKMLESKMQFEQYLSKNEKMTNTFKLQNISRMDTWFLIKSVPPKNSHGFDGFSSKLMNTGASKLVIPMTTIINKCFSSGSFPDKLKTSKICPIYKKNEPEPCNFRPVSLLSCFSKVIEKGAVHQLEKYFKNNFENPNQFAYKANHSCQHALLLTRHKIEMELDKGNFVCLALIDLSLAFDTVETETILPTKLKHYGATETTASFFKSFFTNRKLYTSWNGTDSETVDLHNYSCVQGSCLGPVIFNTYTHDLKEATTSDLVCFADDSNFFMVNKDLTQLIRNANLELDKVQNYFSDNTLMLNKAKSCYLIFKPKGAKNVISDEKLCINGIEIEQVKHARFLGIWLDDELKFTKQYEILYKKLEDTVKALGAVKYILNYRTKILIYHSLFQSHVNYCTIAYFDKLNKGQIADLLALQKKAIRRVFRAKYNVHTSTLFKLANITPIDKTYETEATKFIFQYISDNTKNQQPKAIQKILFQDSEKSRDTRFYDDESKVRISHQYKKGQVIYNLLSNWNHSSANQRFAGNLWSLKNIIREEINNELKPCETKNCFMCKLDKNVDYSRYMKK